MPRKQNAADYTRPETLLSLQRSSLSAGGSSTVDTENQQSPSSSSFRYAAPGSAIKSTQQLPIDWSDFSKHTFFSSAVANVNVAFDSIINNFPFDGTFREVEDYFDGLTGFEAYVFDQFPSSLNSLTLSGSSYVEVIDAAGSKFPELSKNKSGASVLDPGASTISFQFKLFVPPESNDNQIVAQRIVSNSGYTLALSESLSNDSSDFLFTYSSGSSYLVVSSSVNKGEWIDVAAVFNRRPGVNKLQIYLSGNLVSSSNSLSELEVFTSLSSPLYIGTGSSQTIGSYVFTPTKTLSASLDDFKVFVGNRSADDIKYLSTNPAEPRSDLRLHFKFNEPSGSYERNSFVIDSSGNGLHSTITGFDLSMRDSFTNTGGPASFGERNVYNPVLFPDYPSLVTLNESLLSQATTYDSNNPNLIVKLIPSHYLEEEQSELGLTSVDGEIGRDFSDGGSLPRATSLGSVQLITMMLLIWAKQFDEMKMYIDQMSKMNKVGYEEEDSIADTFLPFLAKEYGIELPRLFRDVTYRQYIHGDDLTQDSSIGTNALYQLEAAIWRRILTNMPHVIQSKGTINSIKSIIRSVGIDPDVTLRFKEYGGARSGYISGRKLTKKPIVFTHTGSYLISSPYLSSSRVEPGIPLPSGNSSDGMLTSGSFSFESHFKFGEKPADTESSSLARFLATGSYGESLLLNLILEKSGTTGGAGGNLTLSGSYSTDVTDPERFSISLENVPTYDGYPFYVSFGRNRESADTSNWFLRFGKSVGENLILSESELRVIIPENYDNFSNVSSTYNSSGSYFQIGSSSIVGPSTIFLNDTSLSSFSKLTTFRGAASQVRLWSKHLSGSEWKEHVRNPLSVGVINPSINFNFVQHESGSFERLRVDANFNQVVTASDTLGNITLTDFTQNGFDLVGTGFPVSSQVLSPHELIYNAIDSYFDESSTDSKVRVRSWESEENSEKYGGSYLPVYKVNPAEVPIDDNRFGIEISTVKALSEDMSLMFGGHEPLDNLYGNPADMFSSEYTGERYLREVYFNRLTDPVSFKNVFLFAKWFESNLESLVEQLLPFNTDFRGVNLVVESHMLERNKIRYNWADIYLGENDRRNLKGTIGLSLITAELKKI